MKKLIPAFVMLLISAMLLGTSTFAWFSMNRTVQATNMRVEAIADQGLLINEVATATDANWDDTATTNQTEAIHLHATSTANTAVWYVAHSKLSSSSASASSGTASTNLTSAGYSTLGSGTFATATETIAAVAGTNAQHDITYVDADASGSYSNGEGYYVKFTYYLKSSAEALTLSTAAGSQTLNISGVTVTGNSVSVDLDKALRVAVVVNNKAYIFAPLSGATTTYYVNASATATTVLDHTASQPTALASLPAVTANGTPVYVYLYFEGEDTNLKTDNVISTLDQLTVNVEFELVSNENAVTDNGVAIS